MDALCCCRHGAFAECSLPGKAWGGGGRQHIEQHFTLHDFVVCFSLLMRVRLFVIGLAQVKKGCCFLSGAQKRVCMLTLPQTFLKAEMWALWPWRAGQPKWNDICMFSQSKHMQSFSYLAFLPNVGWPCAERSKATHRSLELLAAWSHFCWGNLAGTLNQARWL